MISYFVLIWVDIEPPLAHPNPVIACWVLLKKISISIFHKSMSTILKRSRSSQKKTMTCWLSFSLDWNILCSDQIKPSQALVLRISEFCAPWFSYSRLFNIMLFTLIFGVVNILIFLLHSLASPHSSPQALPLPLSLKSPTHSPPPFSPTVFSISAALSSWSAGSTN